MKRTMAVALTLALLVTAGTASAQTKVRSWDDYSWWGNSGATPDPVKDSQGRSGYWWWPTEAASNTDDSELWGNRGVVYHSPWEDAAEPAPPAPPAPTGPPAKPSRQIPIFNHVLFDFDKSTLKPEGKAEVDKVVSMLKDNPGDSVEVQGHTCNVGTDEYNMGLSQRRADSVQKYMLDSGVAQGRLSTKAFGETTPAVPNDTPANRKLNRRAMFNYKIGS